MTEAALIDALDIVSASKNYHRWIYESIRQHLGQRLLETGSGFGDFLPYYLEDGQKKVILSDKSEVMLNRLKERYQNWPRVEFKHWDVNSPYDNSPGSDQPDTVISINVLEHIEDERNALINMRQSVRKTGKLILFVPALPVLYGSLDVMAGHCRRYTTKDIREKLEQTGWRLKSMGYFNAWGVMTWFLASRILKKTTFSRGVCRALDNLVPVLATTESFLKPPIGQTIIAIAIRE